MNPKNPLSESNFIADEIRALQSEEVPENVRDRAVFAMQAQPLPSPARKRYAWRFAATGAAIVMLGSFVAFRSPAVNAAEIEKLDGAARAQTTRHTKDFRLNRAGEMVLANEYWIEDGKQYSIFHNPDGTAIIEGFDGRRHFRKDDGGGYIDEAHPEAFPIETIRDYLNIPNAKVESIERNVPEGAGRVDVFVISFGAMKMHLFIEPKSGLPVRRVVEAHEFREENLYDYPSDIPDSKFEVPAGESQTWANYPILNKELAKKLEEPGVTKQLGGVTITLKAVIVGDKQVIALWSGGAKSDFLAEGHLEVVGLQDPYATGLEGCSVWSAKEERRPPKGLLGDSAWFRSTEGLGDSITIRIPVWEEDSTRPLISSEGLRVPGFHSKLLGKLEFSGVKPIYARDAARVIWKPESGVRQATAKQD